MKMYNVKMGKCTGPPTLWFPSNILPHTSIHGPQHKSNGCFFVRRWLTFWRLWSATSNRDFRLFVALSIYSCRGGRQACSPSLVICPRIIYQSHECWFISKYHKTIIIRPKPKVTFDAHNRSACWHTSLISLPDILHSASANERQQQDAYLMK